MDYFCVDVESSGPAPGIHSLLSLGVTHVRRLEGAYRPQASLYLEVQPSFEAVVPKAMEVNRLDLEVLRRDGLPPETAMRRLADFVRTHPRGRRDRPVFVAHNAPFDWMYVAWYFQWTGVSNPFGHSALDTKALAMGKLDVAWVQTSLKTVCSLIGVPSLEADAAHHAGADARHLADVFCALMNRDSSRSGGSDS
jgi:DNA polymerase III epsilon subunit-like protein